MLSLALGELWRQSSAGRCRARCRHLRYNENGMRDSLPERNKKFNLYCSAGRAIKQAPEMQTGHDRTSWPLFGPSWPLFGTESQCPISFDSSGTVYSYVHWVILLSVTTMRHNKLVRSGSDPNVVSQPLINIR